ncbi:MAG: serine/threonine protein kinase [Deltaproteobacteria bacterium]|nr:serine/threonine protein kinase [Deltaproteobacteria bacterium]
MSTHARAWRSGGRLRALRQTLLPPPFDETLSAAQVRGSAQLRALVLGVALGVDVLIVTTLWHDPLVRRAALATFGTVNVGLLLLDLVLTIVLLRRPGPRWEQVFVGCILIEVLTTVVWIQLTGSLSSYFLSASMVLVVLYRVGFAWRHGTLVAVALAGCHTCALVLEALGRLPAASLFVDTPGGIYGSHALRTAAAASVLGSYLAVWAGANLLVMRLRDKDAALAMARQQLARVMEGVETGRLSGRAIGDWLLLELLGAGGMGEVYRAQRGVDGVEAALKVLHPHLAARAEVRERFRREASVAGRLSSCTAALLEVGTSEAGEPFIAWELLRGEDLAARLRRQQVLALPEAVALISDIAGLLEVAHAAGVVHRDLKPSNVFLARRDDGSEQVRLLDFGIAGLLDGSELTNSAAVLGSPGYLAPEQARGERAAVGPHSDVFALGAIAYRALTGQDAFPARDPAAALFEAQHHTPAPASSVQPALASDVDRVLDLALAKRVADRYAGAAELARDLAAAAAGALPKEVRRRAALLRDTSADRTLTSG